MGNGESGVGRDSRFPNPDSRLSTSPPPPARPSPPLPRRHPDLPKRQPPVPRAGTTAPSAPAARGVGSPDRRPEGAVANRGVRAGRPPSPTPRFATDPNSTRLNSSHGALP